MASVSLVCLAVTLILSGSITLATVDVFQSQDRSICGGMVATVTCVTTTAGGFLRWDINNAAVFTVSGQATSFNQTMNGSEFVFVRGISTLGVNIYTSTVSLNTNQTTSIDCSDSIILPQTLDIGFVVESFVCTFTTIVVDADSVDVTWSPPENAGICCNRYRVVTSNGTTVNTSATSITLNNITTEVNPSISIRCMDQFGTLGPEVVYIPNIAPTEPSPPSSSSSSSSPSSPPTSTSQRSEDPSILSLSCNIPWWIWLIIGILAVVSVIATPIAIAMTALYIREKCISKDDNSTIKHGVELDAKL